jgi:hypothetical protein
MSTANASSSVPAASNFCLRSSQLSLAILFFVVLLAVWGSASFASHNAWIRQVLLNNQEHVAETHFRMVVDYKVGFADSPDRLLVDVLPDADYSHGGVYFFGSSVMQATFYEPLLPVEVRKDLHNYSILSMNYYEQFQFIRYLIEKRGLLSAGPEKNLIVLGLSYFDTNPKHLGYLNEKYLPELFGRQGVYDYDYTMGIADKPLSTLERFCRLEWYRAGAWLRALARNSEVRMSPATRPLHYDDDSIEVARTWVRSHGLCAESSKDLDFQLQALHDMLEYLNAHGVRTVAVVLPMATWTKGMREIDDYLQRVHAICYDTHVQLYDLHEQIADDNFCDLTHLNYQGTQLFTPQLADLVMKQWKQAPASAQ